MILGTCSGLLDVALFSPKQAVMLSINWIIDIIRCRWTKKPFTHLQEGLFYNVALSVVIFICLGRPKSGRSRIIPPKRLSWNFPPKWLSWNIPPKRLSWMGMDGPNNVYIYIYISNLYNPSSKPSYRFLHIYFHVSDLGCYMILPVNIFSTKTKNTSCSPQFSLCTKQVFQRFHLDPLPIDPWSGVLLTRDVL